MRKVKEKKDEDKSKPKLNSFLFCWSLFVGGHVIAVTHLALTMAIFGPLIFWIVR
jgi:hypothetical protein